MITSEPEKITLITLITPRKYRHDLGTSDDEIISDVKPLTLLHLLHCVEVGIEEKKTDGENTLSEEEKKRLSLSSVISVISVIPQKKGDPS